MTVRVGVLGAGVAASEVVDGAEGAAGAEVPVGSVAVTALMPLASFSVRQRTTVPLPLARRPHEQAGSYG